MSRKIIVLRIMMESSLSTSVQSSDGSVLLWQLCRTLNPASLTAQVSADKDHTLNWNLCVSRYRTVDLTIMWNDSKPQEKGNVSCHGPVDCESLDFGMPSDTRSQKSQCWDSDRTGRLRLQGERQHSSPQFFQCVGRIGPAWSSWRTQFPRYWPNLNWNCTAMVQLARLLHGNKSTLMTKCTHMKHHQTGSMVQSTTWFFETIPSEISIKNTGVHSTAFQQ